MTAEVLVAELEARGVQLEVDGSELVVRPAGAVTPDDVAALRRAKAEVVSIVRGSCEPTGPASICTSSTRCSRWPSPGRTCAS